MLALAVYLGITGWKLRAFRSAARVLALVPLAALLFVSPLGSSIGSSAILLLLGPGGGFVFSNAYARN